MDPAGKRLLLNAGKLAKGGSKHNIARTKPVDSVPIVRLECLNGT